MDRKQTHVLHNLERSLCVDGKELVGNLQPKDIQDSYTESVWFLKDKEKNFSTGITIGRTLQECLDVADKGCQYVVQPHVPRKVGLRK